MGTEIRLVSEISTVEDRVARIRRRWRATVVTVALLAGALPYPAGAADGDLNMTFLRPIGVGGMSCNLYKVVMPWSTLQRYQFKGDGEPYSAFLRMPGSEGGFAPARPATSGVEFSEGSYSKENTPVLVQPDSDLWRKTGEDYETELAVCSARLGGKITTTWTQTPMRIESGEVYDVHGNEPVDDLYHSGMSYEPRRKHVHRRKIEERGYEECDRWTYYGDRGGRRTFSWKSGESLGSWSSVVVTPQGESAQVLASTMRGSGDHVNDFWQQLDFEVPRSGAVDIYVCADMLGQGGADQYRFEVTNPRPRLVSRARMDIRENAELQMPFGPKYVNRVDRGGSAFSCQEFNFSPLWQRPKASFWTATVRVLKPSGSAGRIDQNPVDSWVRMYQRDKWPPPLNAGVLGNGYSLFPDGPERRVSGSTDTFVGAGSLLVFRGKKKMDPAVKDALDSGNVAPLMVQVCFKINEMDAPEGRFAIILKEVPQYAPTIDLTELEKQGGWREFYDQGYSYYKVVAHGGEGRVRAEWDDVPTPPDGFKGALLTADGRNGFVKQSHVGYMQPDNSCPPSVEARDRLLREQGPVAGTYCVQLDTAYNSTDSTPTEQLGHRAVFGVVPRSAVQGSAQVATKTSPMSEAWKTRILNAAALTVVAADASDSEFEASSARRSFGPSRISRRADGVAMTCDDFKIAPAVASRESFYYVVAAVEQPSGRSGTSAGRSITLRAAQQPENSEDGLLAERDAVWHEKAKETAEAFRTQTGSTAEPSSTMGVVRFDPQKPDRPIFIETCIPIEDASASEGRYVVFATSDSKYIKLDAERVLSGLEYDGAFSTPGSGRMAFRLPVRGYDARIPALKLELDVSPGMVPRSAGDFAASRSRTNNAQVATVKVGLLDGSTGQCQEQVGGIIARDRFLSPQGVSPDERDYCIMVEAGIAAGGGRPFQPVGWKLRIVPQSQGRP